jgi:hypothetical protein
MQGIRMDNTLDAAHPFSSPGAHNLVIKRPMRLPTPPSCQVITSERYTKKTVVEVLPRIPSQPYPSHYYHPNVRPAHTVTHLPNLPPELELAIDSAVMLHDPPAQTDVFSEVRCCLSGIEGYGVNEWRPVLKSCGFSGQDCDRLLELLGVFTT